MHSVLFNIYVSPLFVLGLLVSFFSLSLMATPSPPTSSFSPPPLLPTPYIPSATGALRHLGDFALLPNEIYNNPNVKNYGAEIAVHPNGRFLFCSNRGHGAIAVFAIADSGSKGKKKERRRIRRRERRRRRRRRRTSGLKRCPLSFSTITLEF